MDKKTTFCEECRDFVEYTISDVPLIGKIKGDEYKYSGKEVRCNRCGSLCYLPEINDYNLKALYDTYRTKNGIISLEKIRELPERCGVNKESLPSVLGLDEQTFLRYWDGDIPSKEHNEILTSAYASHEK